MVLLMQLKPLTVSLRAVPEMKSNYQPRSQESECHVKVFWREDCSVFEAKQLSGDAALQQQQQIYQLLAVSSITEAQEEKHAGPSTHPCKLFFRKSCKLGFLPGNNYSLI